MKSLFELLLVCVGIMFLLLVGTACQQKTTIEAKVSEQTPEGLLVSEYSIGKAEISGKFDEEHTKVTLTCTVTVKGKVNGQPFEKTYEIKLEAEGTPGGSYYLSCTDPLLLQLPLDACNFVGTFSGPSSGFLNVETDLASVPIAPGHWLEPEAGTQFVRFTMPEDVPDGDYQSSVTFDLDYSRDIEMKSVMLGEIKCNRRKFYPPLIPCVTSMSQVDPVIIPASDTLVEILPDLDNVQACTTLVDCMLMTPIPLPLPKPVSFPPGDNNGDGSVDIGDAVYLINHIFKDGPAPARR